MSIPPEDVGGVIDSVAYVCAEVYYENKFSKNDCLSLYITISYCSIKYENIVDIPDIFDNCVSMINDIFVFLN